jgi:hypothetical protein
MTTFVRPIRVLFTVNQTKRRNCIVCVWAEARLRLRGTKDCLRNHVDLRHLFGSRSICVEPQTFMRNQVNRRRAGINK